MVTRDARKERNAMPWDEGIARESTPGKLGSALVTVAASGVLLLVLLAPLPAAAAEGSCELSLKQASELFDAGRFPDARAAIDACLAGRPNRAERSRALGLVAKIHLALDDVPAAEATVARLLENDADFQPDLFDPPRFVRMVAMVKGRQAAPTVTSVSKSKESLAEAPATVVVITGEEIARRGYTDLEAVLRDLPGFDFSRRAGPSYSNVYQRGYRSIETTRTMLLVDGVEDNDLASSTAWISRQFPLSNIERIEVVYGPASTMYGANAFAGVINVITKEPEQIVGEGKAWGTDARVGATTDAGMLDATVAGQIGNGSLRWSLTARKWKGDDFEHLKDHPQWDYDPAFYSSVDYTALAGLNATTPAAVAAILAKYTPAQLAPYFRVTYDALGNPVAIHLTPEGAARARGLDQAFYTDVVGGFGSPVDDWMVSGKISAPNFTFGFQTWRQMEGGGVPLVDTFAAPGRAGFLWTPEHTSIFAKYSQRYLDGKLSGSIFLQYKQHELDGTDSADVYLANYHRGSLRIEDLLLAKSPFLSATYKYRSNDQLRTEINTFWEPSDKLNVVGGLELRYSSIGAKNVTSTTAPPEETGTTPTGVAGGNQISSRDLGAFVQASWRPVKPLKLVGGVRVDDNRIRVSGGFGTVANPRLAAIYGWKEFTFKAIYSEAFQDAPNFQKYETTPSRLLDNPTLAPEKVRNFELSAGWAPGRDLSVQVVGYRATYEGIVEEVSGVRCPPTLACTTTNQFQNVGALEILGAQVEGQWSPGRYRIVGSYTFADPQDTVRDLRVGDIADHRFGLSASARLFGDRLDANLRLNAAVGRKTGKGTTVTASPYTKIDDYVIAGGAATYRNLFLPGLDLQLSVENLLDTDWYEPSLRNPSGFPIAAQMPQPGRTFFLRLRMTR
jgi:outer membrane receptor protein involved in Fe transport